MQSRQSPAPRRRAGLDQTGGYIAKNDRRAALPRTAPAPGVSRRAIRAALAAPPQRQCRAISRSRKPV